MARNAKLNYFPLTHQRLTSMDLGKIYPVDFVECLPGDVFRIQNEFLIRFMPTIAPVMNRFKIALRWWYCPTRLLWDDWTNFITGGPDGMDNSTPPYITAGESGFVEGSLADFFRVPTGIAGAKCSALPFRMYDLIFNEWYRNEAIQDPLTISKASGSDVTTSLDLQRVNWKRDYYTDALPSVQKGPAVGIPLAGDALVKRVSGETGIEASGYNFTLKNSGNSGVLKVESLPYTAGTKKSVYVDNNSIADLSSLSYSAGLRIKDSSLYADMTNVSATTINQLRQAAAIQQFQELNMRGGNTYVNWVLNHYGVRTPDASLQRPIYVGGMTSNMVISEVLQTSESTQTSAQGTMAGHGIGAGTSPLLKFRSLENGYLMCLMTVVPDSLYFQGMPRELTRETRYDFAIPLLQHLGEQEIRNKEIFMQGESVVDDDGNVVDEKVFGYVPRYEEYRRIPNAVTGALRSSLSFWTSARKFTELPTLSADFVAATPNPDFFAVEDGADHLVVQVVHHMDALRPLSKRGTPGMHII